MLNLILGVSGFEITPEEREVFKRYRPAGLILFQRNCKNRKQVKELTEDFYSTVEDPLAFVMIDEEGGKVQRMLPPEWEETPPMREFGRLFEKNPEHGVAELRRDIEKTAAKLKEVGINMNAAPTVDLIHPRASDVIGTRSFSENPQTVAKLGKTVADTFLENGIIPIVKHIPGHGRAKVDSHVELPKIDAPLEELMKTDFHPFAELVDQPFAMVAHIIFTAIDPLLPCSISAKVRRFIRDELGFQNPIMSDCIFMEALQGEIPSRAEKVIEAGYDFVLSCHGEPGLMEAVAKVCRPLNDFQRSKLTELHEKIQG